MSDPADYRPRPIETSGDRDPLGPPELIERLAENAHAIWARWRSAEQARGSSSARDADSKAPLFVPWPTLPEPERQLDRELVVETLRAARVLGFRVEPPAPPATDAESAAADAWRAALARSARAHSDPTQNAARPDFDMNDAPELADPALPAFPRFLGALRELQNQLYPTWKSTDDEAARLRRRHHRIALGAIAFGTAAILAAVAQLAAPASAAWSRTLPWIEFACAAGAATCVISGLATRSRDKWLAARHTAEQLRALKFRALADVRLWHDFQAWRAKLSDRMQDVLTTANRGHAANATDAHPAHQRSTLAAELTTAESRALAAYYVTKRAWYQREYFVREQHRGRFAAAWHHRNLGVALVLTSLALVFVHVGLELVTHPPHALLTWLVALAAALPVLGFGVRAWLGAFETPRRHALFRNHAERLERHIAELERRASVPSETLAQIAHGESVFEHERAEWSRLLSETEWFV
ncbi:MAG: DUF4231 domain-containing protein [Planctomycetes bacterium]|nr:DUF4231 domain-containing protein [Planctomycetota bacterium]